jgi:hypothetical protein
MDIRVAQHETSDLTRRAIEAGKVLLGREIVIQTNADLTPPGKRVARVVHHAKSGRRTGPQIRWYVAGSCFRNLKLTEQNTLLSAEWVAAGS